VPAAARPTYVARAITSVVVAMLLFTVLDATVKYLAARGYSTWQLVFCRSLFSFVVLLPLVRAQGGRRALVTRRPLDHLCRGAVGMAALWCWFYAYRNIPLADAYALSFSAPLFMTALSVPMLGEPVGRQRWAAVLVGLAGVLIMIQPGGGMFDASALVVLLSALLYALAMILLRGLGATETTLGTVFYFTLFCTLVSAASLPFTGRLPQSWGDAGLLVAIGLLGGVAQLFLTEAYRCAPVSIVAPFDYSAMLWAVLLGMAVFGERPGWPVLTGAAVVIASGLYILHRESVRRGRPRRPSEPGPPEPSPAGLPGRQG
jgi:drug/metabolite transporter (DMT)-like permease